MRLQQNSRPGVGPVTKPQPQPGSYPVLSVALPRFGELAKPANAARIAAQAEALGFRAAWFLCDAGSSAVEALALVANLSARTRTIGFATEVSPASSDAVPAASMVATAKMVAGDRVSVGFAGANDRSLAFDYPVPAVALTRNTRDSLADSAVVATCQVTYQPIECGRRPFNGTFDQIARDIVQAHNAGASEVILDFSYSASVSSVQDFNLHLQRIREATNPGFSVQAVEDPFDYSI